MKYILAILALILMLPTAAAAKHDGCYSTQAKARAVHKTVRLKFVKKSGRPCWYASPVRIETPAFENRVGPAPDRVVDTFMQMTAQPWHYDLWLKIQIGWLGL